MGLGFYFKAVPKTRTSAARILKGISAELPAILKAAPFRDWTVLVGDDSQFKASLHPAAEDMGFFLDDGSCVLLPPAWDGCAL
jgi:hypothetical protein